MPYIDQKSRQKIDYEAKSPENVGELNYLITRLVDEYLCKKGLKYEHLNAVVGVLECAKLELYRRIAMPYEDKKIQENGDVYNAKSKNH